MYVYTKNIGSLINIFMNDKIHREQNLYNKSSEKKLALEKNINNIIENDSSIIAKYIGNMIGGNFFTEDVTPQIAQLKTLFDEYNQLINTGSERIKENAEEIKKKTETILESLNKINFDMQNKVRDKSIEIEKVVGPQTMMQDLDYLLLDLQKEGTTEGIYKRLIELRTQRIPLQKMEEYVKFKNYSDKLKEYNQQLKLDKQSMVTTNAGEIAVIREKYDTISEEIKRYMTELDMLIDMYNKKNKEYIESMKISQEALNPDKLVIFDPTNPKDREANAYTEDLSMIENSLFGNPELGKEISVKIKEFFNPDGLELRSNLGRNFKTMKIKNVTPENILHLRGGVLEDLEVINVNFVSLINEYKRKFTEYKKIFDEYNFLTLSILQHLIYVLSVISTSIFETSTFSIFNFIGKGSVNYYLRIIKKIINDFTNPNTSNQPHIVEMRKNHYATIMILDNFLSQIIKKLNAKQKINFYKSGIDVQRNITLLNHFRIILDEFNALNLGKVSIFSRINNLKFDDVNKKELRMFMSDYEIKQQEIKQLVEKQIDKLPDYLELIENLNLEEQTETIIKMIGKKSDYINRIQLDQKYLSTPDNSDELMWIVKDPCNTYKNPSYNIINPLSSMKFTEVFDSTQFPGNDDISKYMQIATRLKDGYGVCLITYGYSGTGKTFTLFGDKGSASSPPVNGLLQATLGELNGLEEISFRVYELYGYGVPYTQYWIDKQNNNATRVDNIDSILFKYKLNLGSGNILEARYDTYIDKYSDIIEFIKKTKDSQQTDAGYIKINSISKIKDAFANFKVLTDGIDEIRKTEITDEITDKKFPPRIRDTPNNKESSRSIIIYEFKLTIKENGVNKVSTFLIVDLPGREDIAKTFVDPYQKPSIQNAIKVGFEQLKPQAQSKLDISNVNDFNHYQSSNDSDKYLSYIRLLILTMTLNPMVVPVLAPQQFISYIENKRNQKIIQEIVDAELLTEKYGAGKPKDTTDSIPEYKKLPMKFEYINSNNEQISKLVNFNEGKITPTDLIPIGYDDEFGKLQYKIVFCIHFMNRLLLLKKFNIVKEIYEKIINDKINVYLEKYIETLDLRGLKEFIQNAINENFKGEYLKLKLQTQKGLESTFININSIIIKFFINGTPLQSPPPDDDLKKVRKYIYNEIKYNYTVNGFEGIYINENIMGIVKYLKGLSLNKGEINNEEKLRLEMEQNTNLGFAFQQKIARMLLASNLIYTVGKQTASNEYKTIKENKEKLNKILELEKINKEKFKLEKLLNDIEIEESAKKIKLVPLFKIKILLENNSSIPDDLKKLIKIIIPNIDTPSNQQIIDKIQEIFLLAENKDKVKQIENIFNKLTPLDTQIKRLKRENNISEALYEAMNLYSGEIYGILFGGKTKDYDKLYERLFNPGFIFRDPEIFNENFSRLNSGYQPDKIFTFRDPIIKNILSPYVDEVDGKALVSDYKVFYLFANYGTEIEQVGQLKCANQNELLITTRNFIESVTK